MVPSASSREYQHTDQENRRKYIAVIDEREAPDDQPVRVGRKEAEQENEQIRDHDKGGDPEHG